MKDGLEWASEWIGQRLNLRKFLKIYMQNL